MKITKPRSELMQAIFPGQEVVSEAGYLRLWVSRLRAKIGAGVIGTKAGRGYGITI